MAKPGNKNNKARCEKYKQQGRREINKRKKQEKHKKLMDKFAKRKESGKTYEYKPNPYKKDSKEYIREANIRAEKNKDKMLPISRFDSIMQKADNYLLKLKNEEKKLKDLKSNSNKDNSTENNSNE